MQAQAAPQIDKNALSRQLAVYGAQTQGKLMAMKVFLLGVRGLGIEVAKNLILAGPKKVEICDNQLVKISDLGSNFYLTEAHVGKVTRAEAVRESLQNLNPAVDLKVSKNHDIAYIVDNFTCVVITDHYDQKYLVDLNNACRSKNIGFIYAGNLGLYGFAFVDFGDKHMVHDKNGEQCRSTIIVGISNDAEGLVYSHEDKRHGFEDGDVITFKEVKGMTEVNGKQFKITVKSPHTFSIGDASGFSPYECNGIAEQVKVPEHIQFKSLEKSLVNPYAPGKKELDLCSWEKIGRPQELHVILNGLLKFHQTHHRLPKALSADDAKEVTAIVNKYIADAKEKMEIEGEMKVQKVDEKLISNVALYAQTQISPCCSFWGGIITQEVVKLTGKYSPLRQWLHHQFIEILPEDTQRNPSNSRYYDYEVLLGNKFVHDAADVSTFLVGAGALGCQFIKMAALMGLARKGKFTCTDDDNIEISNLNRQFLFRKENVGGNKSQVACQAGKRMNPEVNFQSVKLRVDPQNEETFNDQFWENLSFVINAVDNVKARLYVDNKCVWYEKPLFESGTLGTKCNSQDVIPKYTQSYGDSQDPPEETQQSSQTQNSSLYFEKLPYEIAHCIQWARDYFQGAFVDGPSEASKYYENPTVYIDKTVKELKNKPVALRAKLEEVKKLIHVQQKHSYEACIEVARTMFQDIFYNQIAQLLHSFPLDHKTEAGKLFWSGLKRPPVPVAFNSSDPKHLEFVQATANIFAHIFGLSPETNLAKIAKMSDNVIVPEFQPRRIVIKTDDKETAAAQAPKEEDDQQIVLHLEKELRQLNLNKSGVWHLIEFEKDDPTNFHIEQVGSVSNLRARNYKIEQVDNFKVKLIAGKIIPAIATTTAMVVGAVGIEIIKKILGLKNQFYKNSFMNLALPLWVFSDPLPPIEHQDKAYDEILLGPVKAIPPKFTIWDKINVKGPMTLGEFRKHFETTYKVSLSMISIGQTCVYNKYSAESTKREGTDILKVYETVSGKPYPKFKKYMQIEANGETVEDSVDVIMPTVKYQL